MKLSELFESTDEVIDVEQLAKAADFKCKSSSKTISGKKYAVFELTKDVILGELAVQFLYVVNKETQGWVFSAGLQDKKERIEFSDGEDLTSLKKHLKKKKKLTPHQIKEYLQDDLSS